MWTFDEGLRGSNKSFLKNLMRAQALKEEKNKINCIFPD